MLSLSVSTSATRARAVSRKFAATLVMFSTVTAGSLTVSAQANAVESFGYTVHSDGTATVTGCVGTCPTSLTIPATLGSRSVTAVADWAFGNKSLTTVTIPSSVKSIGVGAFATNQLVEFTIPSSVNSIASRAFTANQLATISIPPSVTSLGDSVFANNKLTSISIPATLTELKETVFYGNLLTSVTIPTSVTTIGRGAFAANKLDTVVVPASVVSLDTLAFAYNKLASVNFSGACPTAATGVFDGNAGLKAVGVSYIAENCGATLSGINVNRAAPIGKPASAPKIRWAMPGDAQIRLAIWCPHKDGGSEIIRYEYTLDDGGTWATVDESSTKATLVIKGLDNGTQYSLKVRAFNSAGGGVVSNGASAMPRTKADAPTIDSVTGLSAKIKVDFTAPEFTGGEVITRYAYSIDGGAWHSWNAMATASPQYIRGLKPGVTYAIRLRAYTTAGWGEISGEASATPIR